MLEGLADRLVGRLQETRRAVLTILDDRRDAELAELLAVGADRPFVGIDNLGRIGLGQSLGDHKKRRELLSRQGLQAFDR
ncbi:hypothetical protein [Pelagicoccus sp. SDUM812002]|uniref:hypothetical protein n=1 Tax=Pelagicoccus sp. SDUM812002 TaxID=3041266 RepID=UPI00280CA243|nr:hypothetical protein [Pelagicoccus sp. SDUM812002]MDQ8184592.1 hypothetical protein [Pelagicoccus sp. SDUM812002]